MRLFIADSDQYLRVGLQMLLHQEAGMQVTGIAVHSRGVTTQVEASQPDMLLLDWNLPGQPMTDLLLRLRGLEFPPWIVVLSVRSEDERAAMAAGADAFFCKIHPPGELVAMLGTLSLVKK